MEASKNSEAAARSLEDKLHELANDLREDVETAGLAKRVRPLAELAAAQSARIAELEAALRDLIRYDDWLNTGLVDGEKHPLSMKWGSDHMDALAERARDLLDKGAA